MTDKQLALAPGEDCFRAVQHSGNPKGSIETIAGIETYIASPSKSQSPKGIIIFYADVYGPMYINNKLIQDYFAEQGVLVSTDSSLLV